MGNDNEPGLNLGDEFNRELRENNQVHRLKRTFGEFYCRQCDRAWASQNVWVIDGTKRFTSNAPVISAITLSSRGILKFNRTGVNKNKFRFIKNINFIENSVFVSIFSKTSS